MEELTVALQSIINKSPISIRLSSPREKGQKGSLSLRLLPDGRWQASLPEGKKVRQQNIELKDLPAYLEEHLQHTFYQLQAQTEEREYSLRITSKGKLLTHNKALAATIQPAQVQHNRVKASLLPEGTIIPPLVDMGVFTPDGRVAKAMYAKYRQINRFLEQVEDALGGWDKPLTIIDFGCGKSYLTFILYYYLTQVRGLSAQITGLDLKADVVENCNIAAQKYGYKNLHFEVGDIAKDSQNTPVDMVVTLHACDTATDYALASAVRRGASMIFSVPCCQHELNSQMQGNMLPLLTRYGLVQERTAALMTDAIRANLLVACGYKAQLLEFVDFAHTPKNILIRAVKTGMPAAQKQKAMQEVEQLIQAFSFKPTLLGLLQQQNSL
ncbi:MAG: class I SAM-dependent methyltransferase [Oscillospiraceae bacterium]